MFVDDGISTGQLPERLQIGGRPGAGRTLSYVLLEEPGQPVRMHYDRSLNRKTPHLRDRCPTCLAHERMGFEFSESDLTPLWYIGATALGSWAPCAVELTIKCLASAEAAARRIKGTVGLDLFGDQVDSVVQFRTLLIRITQVGEKTPRVLRAEQRVLDVPAWPFNTRIELARTWGVAIKPRLYKEDVG